MDQKISASLLARWAKPAVIIVFTVLWLLVAWARACRAAGETALDASWLMGLATTFQQGLISGRDFHFTYGPLSQLLAAWGVSITGSGSAFDAYWMIVFLFLSVSIIITSVVILLIDQLSWKHAIAVYLSIAWMNLIFDVPTFRVLLIVLMAVLIYRMLVAISFTRQAWWAVLAGLFCFTEQLATPELTIYGLLTLIIVIGIHAARSREFAKSLALLGISVAIVVIANFGISIAFMSTSADYRSLFDYQRYTLEVMRGYQNMMGLDWDISLARTFGFLGVGAFTVYATLRIWRTGPREDGYLFLCLLVASLISLKSATVRSEVGHVTQALKPLIFTFLLLGQGFLIHSDRSKFIDRYLRQGCWMALFIGLLLLWPWTALYAVNDLRLLATGEISAPSLEQLSSKRAAAESILPAELVHDSPGAVSTPMLNFPYQNYMAILLKRPVFAPVLQSYSAGTEELQRFFVDRLELQRKRGLDVTYGLDDVASWPVDGIQTISRVPIIFEYLYRNFELRSIQQNENGIYLLESRSQPREIVDSDLSFEPQALMPLSGEVKLPQPVHCGLVALQVRMTYPMTLSLSKAAGIQLTFRAGNQVLQSNYLKPIEPNQPFRTYVSLTRPAEFYRFFASEPVPARAWDSIRYSSIEPDWLGVAPNRVQIQKVECVNPQVFRLDERPPEALEGFSALPDLLSGQPETGYFIVNTESGKPPLVFVKIVHVTWKRSYITVSPAALGTRASADLGTTRPNSIGIAIANPGGMDNEITLRLSGQGQARGISAALKLGQGSQLSKVLSEIFPRVFDEIPSQTLTLQGTAPFSLLVVCLDDSRFTTLPIEIQEPAAGPLTFPQFAIHGGWGTEIILSNRSDAMAVGHVNLFAPDHRPLKVTLNGVENHTFEYSLAPGQTVRLSPVRSKQ